MLYELSYSQFWKDAKNLCQDMFEDTNFTDVTLVCGEGKKFKAHKVILSSCSSLFKTILINNPNPNPLVYFHDIKEEQMENLVKFIYTGETSVVQEDLDALLEVAEKLQIKGLASSHRKDEDEGYKKPEEKDNMFNQVVDKAIEDYAKNEAPPDTEKESRGADDFVEQFIESEQENNCNDDSIDDDQVEIIPEKNIMNDKNAVKREVSLGIEEEIVDKKDQLSTFKGSAKKFYCTFCDHKSTTSSNLNTHMKSQHGFVKEKVMRTDAKFPCDKCDYRATQSGNLSSHKRMKHEGLRFPCNFCSHESGSTSNLKTHIKYRHSEEADTRSSR